MDVFHFSGLGTTWSISTDGEDLRTETKKNILSFAENFEKRFSRFLPESESNALREAAAGTYPVSPDFVFLLQRAKTLRELTGGIYDPGFGKLLEYAGYDKEYRLLPQAAVESFRLPRWSLEDQRLTIDGPIVFDFGGIGKGLCIDRLSEILAQEGYRHFLVEGGGDMYGNVKLDDQGFRIALEWPGKPDTAFGIINLKKQGVAVSDSFKRRWGNWHHIIDPQSKKPIETILGCTAVANNSFDADSMTSGLFLSSPEAYPALAKAFDASYVVFKSDGTILVSENWQGELF